jgi:hypothetical protein
MADFGAVIEHWYCNALARHGRDPDEVAEMIRLAERNRSGDPSAPIPCTHSSPDITGETGR